MANKNSGSSKNSQVRQRRTTLLLLLVILLLGLFLRVYRIGSESFWIDEGATAMAMEKYDVAQLAKNIIIYGIALPEYYSSGSDLSVYYLTAKYWSELFGVSETSLRLYSVIFGLLSIVFVFLIAKLLFGRKNAIISSFLMAISVPAIAFSQEARYYSMYLFLGTASMYFLVKVMKSNRNYDWIAYFLFTALGIYTQFLFVILLMFQGLYTLYHLMAIKGYSINFIFRSILKRNSKPVEVQSTSRFAKGKLKRIFLVYLVITLLIVPLVIRLSGDGAAEPWWSKPTIGGAVKIFMNFSTWIYPTVEAREKIKQGLILDLGVFDLLLFLSVAMTAIVSYLLILYLIYLRARKKSLRVFLKREKEFVLLLGWFGFPLLFSFVLSVLTQITIFGIFQYFFYGVAPFVILVSQGMIKLKPKVFKIVFVFFLIVNIMPLYAYYSNVDKQQWRELADYMKGKIKDDEVVVISSDSGEVAFRYYYGDRDNIYGVENLEETKEIIKDKERLWLILSHWKYQDPEGTIQGHINKNYEVLDSLDSDRFFDIEVHHFSKKEGLAAR